MKENKIKLVGKLLGIKLGYQLQKITTYSDTVEFVFLNKEGTKQYYPCFIGDVLKYCTYTKSDLFYILFHC